MGSIPHIYQRAAFPLLGDPRCIAHIRETILCYCVKLYKDTKPIRAMFSLGSRLLSVVDPQNWTTLKVQAQSVQEGGITNDKATSVYT